MERSPLSTRDLIITYVFDLLKLVIEKLRIVWSGTGRPIVTFGM